ncbi:MAG: hypothetical protein Q9221_009070 [Calogaya cf. arnoldii]
MQLLPPPTDRLFPTLAELLQATNKHAKAQGYAVNKARTDKKGTDEVLKAYLRCERGGVFKPSGNRTRHKPTLKTDCKFLATAVYRHEPAAWELVLKNPDHNHDPVEPIRSRVHCREAMNPDVVETIRAATESNTKPGQIFTSLRVRGGETLLVSKRDIYNVRQLLRQQALGPLTAFQALLQHLDNG